MANDPVVKLKFDGDSRAMVREIGRVDTRMRAMLRGIDDGAVKAIRSLGKLQDSLARIKPVDVSVTADTGKAEASIKALGDAGPKMIKVPVDADLSKAEASLRSLGQARPVIVPVRADTGQAEAQIRGMGKDAGSAAGESAGKGFGGKFLGALAGVGFVSTLSGIAADAFSAAAEKTRVTAGLQNQMGITPEAAKMYGARVGEAYSGGLGDSKEQIAGVYSSLSSDVTDWSNRTMASQDNVSKRQVKVVQAFGVDTVQAVGAASAAVTNKLVPSFEDAQDLLVTGYQILGSRGDDWADTLKEYSGYFKNLGFDGATALGTINQMIKAGARDTDYAADAFKEFNIRIIDGSELTKQALKDLGKDFKNIPQEITKGGPAALGALDKVIDKIKTIKDPIKQNEIGVALFGTQWEDTMRQVVSSVDISSAAIGGKFTGAVDKLAVATDTNVEKFQRRWENGLSIVGDKLAGWANDGAALMDGFATMAQNSLKKVGDQHPFNAITEGIQKAVDFARKNDIQVKAQADYKQVEDIHNRLMKLPRNTPVKVQGMTQEAEQNLINLGWSVTHLPGGVVSVSANTKPAVDQSLATLRWLNSLAANITVGVVGPGKNYALKNIKGGMAALASGGWVAGGGTRTSDSVPTALSRDEFVTNAHEANKPWNKPVLEDMNAGRPWWRAMAPPASAPAASSGGGRAGGTGGGAYRLVATAGADSETARFIATLVRNNQLQLVPAS